MKRHTLQNWAKREGVTTRGKSDAEIAAGIAHTGSVRVAEDFEKVIRGRLCRFEEGQEFVGARAALLLEFAVEKLEVTE